jgi:ribosomal protein S6--L-glutamate ligase
LKVPKVKELFWPKPKAAESVINAFKSVNANILVKSSSKWKRHPLFVIDGKVVASIQRGAMPGEFKTNIHLGGTASG